jgi:hypothetical protein
MDIFNINLDQNLLNSGLETEEQFHESEQTTVY